MDRRSFFRTMIGGVAAAAAVRTFPFRVFSFPSEITIPPIRPYMMEADSLLPELATIYYDKQALDALKANLIFHSVKPFNGENYHGVIHPMRLYEYKSAARLYEN